MQNPSNSLSLSLNRVSKIVNDAERQKYSINICPVSEKETDDVFISYRDKGRLLLLSPLVITGGMLNNNSVLNT